MKIDRKITSSQLRRSAYIYIRQSTEHQLRENIESRQRQIKAFNVCGICIEAYFINRVEGLLFTQVDHCVSSDFILGSVLWKNTPWIPINPSFFGYHNVPVSLS